MSKILSLSLMTVSLMLAVTEFPSATIAGTCASKCGSRPIQFTPGKLVRIEVVNSTRISLNIQKPDITEPISLQPGQKLLFQQREITQANMSLLFWDENGSPLQATISKPDFATLQIELRPNWRSRGDRAVYILDNGRVKIL